MIDRFRRISYFLAYAVATIPLWHYIRDGRILMLMVAVMIFAYIMVVLSSVQASHTILNSEKSKVTFPRRLPNKPKYRKWWSLFRHTLKWHLLLVPPKMGLALGFTEILTNTRVFSVSVSRFISLDFYMIDQVYSAFYPQWETLLLGSLFILTFSIMMNCFISAVIISTKKTFQHVFIKIIAIIFATFGTVEIIISPPVMYDAGCRGGACHTISILPTKPVYSAGGTLLGQGIMLSANIMRPIYRTPSGYWDNREYVAQQSIYGTLGLVIYAILTWGLLVYTDDTNRQKTLLGTKTQ